MSAQCQPDLWPIALKICKPITSALGNVYTNFGFSEPASFQIKYSYETDGRTDIGYLAGGRVRPVARA